MNYVVKNSKEPMVFKYFEDISMIPRSSGNEKEIADYLVDFAVSHSLWYNKDNINNVVIKKPASKGKENNPIVVLQGHTDMVCEKNKEVVHNFDKDPLKLITDGDFLYADGTTLGGDNGMAVAYMLSVLDDEALEHPALECIFTVGEEVGFEGAYGLDKTLIKGRTMINLDSEEEGIATISCAGGGRIGLAKKLEYAEKNNMSSLKITVSGLVGGHSGTDIKFVRLNANILLGRLLYHINNTIKLNLSELNGGSKDNAIPREAEAIIAVNTADVQKVKDIISDFTAAVKKEYYFTEQGLKIEAFDYNENIKITSEKCSNEILSALMLLPNGVQLLDCEFNDFVVSSINLGVISTKNDEIHFTFAPRSSAVSAMELLKEKVSLVAKLCNFDYEMTSEYPGWERAESSKIRDIFIDTYKNLFNADLKCEAIHAGLECGLWAKALSGLDAIAIGPNIFDCHTPQERVEIASCDRTYQLLKAVLKQL